MFLLVSSSYMYFNIFSVLCVVKANEQKKLRTKTFKKETGEFYNRSRFTNYGLV